jgi:hypothetical protein
MLSLTPITCVGDELQWCDKVKKKKKKESAQKNKKTMDTINNLTHNGNKDH